MARSTKPTFGDQLKVLRPRLNRCLMERCWQLNQMAKIADGRSVALLCKAKTNGLDQLLARGSVSVKRDVLLGVKVVLVGIPETAWLHSKVVWMNEARLFIGMQGVAL